MVSALHRFASASDSLTANRAPCKSLSLKETSVPSKGTGFARLPAQRQQSATPTRQLRRPLAFKAARRVAS
jgi:hypothetical protein